MKGGDPPGRRGDPTAKKRRAGRQKPAPRSEINSSVMAISTAGCPALFQNFRTAFRV
jgi:hypothetical protein